MKVNDVFVTFLLLIGLCPFVKSQTIDRQVFASGGSDFFNPSGNISFTIGEPVTETLSGGNISITQGFHQGIINITSIQEQLSDREISIYPNPTTDYVTVKFDGIGLWKLFSIDGKLINSGELTFGSTSIDMRTIALATYMLTIIGDDNRMNTYRVVKTH